MRPKERLVVTERTKFVSMKQEFDEPIIKYLHSQRNASRYCEFEKLRQEEQTIEEDLIQLRITEGMYNASQWYKITEQLQIGNVSLNTCIDCIQQQELILKSNNYKSQPSEQIFVDTYILKQIKIIFVLWMWTWNKKEKCPVFGKNCTHCLKKNIFKQYAISKRKKTLKELKKTKQIWKYFQ